MNELLNQINDKFNRNFNSILINKYNNGLENVNSHSDKCNGDIISLSYGTTRKYRIRDLNKKIVKDIDLKHMEILMINENLNKNFKHEIVKSIPIKNCRYSLTFREIEVK